jgi:hypothetical protein
MPAAPQSPVRTLYVLVRVPKSGTTSLVSMMGAALPAARFFYMPKLMRSDEGPSRIEKLRAMRSRGRRFWKLFRTLPEDTAWRRLAAEARDGDVVSGHFPYGAVRVPGAELRHITLLRDPLARLLSEYHYTRAGIERRGPLHRLTRRGSLAEAALGSFSDYLAFLDEHSALYANIATRYVTGSPGVDDPVAFLERSYFHFGALERLDLFTAALSAKLGSAVAAAHERPTSNKAPVELSSADRAIFERLFEQDIRMHRDLIRHLDRSEDR